MKKARFIYLVLVAALFGLLAATSGPLGLSDGGNPLIRFHI